MKTLGVNPFPSRFINRMVLREGFTHRHYHPSPLSSSSTSSSNQRQRQQQQKHHHRHQYHLYCHHLNIFTIITITIIITKPFSSSSSSLLSSLLQLFGRKTCWKRGGVYAILGGTPLLFFSQSTKTLHLKKRAKFWYVLKRLNAPGFGGVAQGMLKYRDPQSAHYLDFRNRKSAFLCYYQTTTNFFHSVQNSRNFIWPYYLVLKSRWCRVDTETN